MADTLILGVGNLLMGDDAAGVRIPGEIDPHGGRWKGTLDDQECEVIAG